MNGPVASLPSAAHGPSAEWEMWGVPVSGAVPAHVKASWVFTSVQVPEHNSQYQEFSFTWRILVWFPGNWGRRVWKWVCGTGHEEHSFIFIFFFYFPFYLGAHPTVLRVYSWFYAQGLLLGEGSGNSMCCWGSISGMCKVNTLSLAPNYWVFIINFSKQLTLCMGNKHRVDFLFDGHWHENKKKTYNTKDQWILFFY